MSGEPPFLFLHIPRTAGTTLNRLLERHFPPETVLSLYSREELQRYAVIDVAFLARLRLIQGHILLSDYDRFTFYDAPVRAFTFVREPVSRVISEYFFLRTWPANHLYALLNEQHITLSEYVTSKHKLLRYKGGNFMTRVLSGIDPDVEPDAALERAKSNLRDRFLFFGLTEAFNASLLLLAEAMGLGDLLYERQNALRRPVSQRADEDERALIAARNTLDTALYDFAKQLFAERVAAKGSSFTARLTRYETLLGKYQKVCALVETRLGVPLGEIEKPKD